MKPRGSSAPSNVEWVIEDAEDPWVYETPFDYIHGRALTTCFKSPLDIFKKAFAALRPGGYFEMQDPMVQKAVDDSFRGTTLAELADYISTATAATGRLWTHVPQYPEYFREAGFVDIVEHDFRWPTNPHWPESEKEKVLGLWMQAQVQTGVLESATTRIFTKMLGWDKERLDAFLVKAKEDMKSKDIKAFTPV